MRNEHWLLPLTVLIGLALGVSREERRHEAPVRTLSITTASWCKPCKRLKKDLEDHPEIVDGVAVEFIEDDFAAEVPKLELLIDGGIVKETVGYHGPDWLRRWLEIR
jgi:thiol-disulfide isomerase/thioredoxin